MVTTGLISLSTADLQTHELKDSQIHGLTPEIFCGMNILFFADTLRVQQSSNKIGMLLPLVQVV